MVDSFLLLWKSFGQKQLWKKGVLLYHLTLLRGWNWSREYGGTLLTGPAACSSFSYPATILIQPRTACPGMAWSTAVEWLSYIHQENAPQTCQQAKLMETTPQEVPSFQLSLAHGNLTKTSQTLNTNYYRVYKQTITQKSFCPQKIQIHSSISSRFL